MCGKTNPSDIDVCRFCQARLKPLTDALNDKNDDFPVYESISGKSDLPDWMDEIRDVPESLEHNLSGEWSEEDLNNSHGTATDWLSRIEETPKDVDKNDIADQIIQKNRKEEKSSISDDVSKDEKQLSEWIDDLLLEDLEEDFFDLEAVTLEKETDSVGIDDSFIDKNFQKEKSSFTQEEPTASQSLYDEQFEEFISDIPDTDELSEDDIPEAENGGDGLLSPADLPTWLEAIRPDSLIEEDVQGIEAEQTASVERAGPLAGLSNVLPAEPDIALPGEPTNLISKINISEQQSVHVKILQDILKHEQEPRILPTENIVSSRFILRGVVFFTLVLAIFFPIVLDIPKVNLPNRTPEVSELNQMISELNGSRPILMIVDYQAGYSGEMDAISGVILDHLISKRIYLVFASTTNTGAIQAEHLIQKVNRSIDNPYETPSNYVNLGLISAGSSGILAFSQDPRLIRPSSIDSTVVWENPQLETIYHLSDFAMLIVATENPETARSWIEQAQPQLGNTPLVILTSSQAEPLVRPYFETKSLQIQGYLGGLNSAVQYQSLLGRMDGAIEYWSAYSIGVLAAILVSFFCILYFLIEKSRKHARNGSELRE